MPFTLHVARYRGAPPPQPISASFGDQGGDIGRALDNFLVLPDPEKRVSRKHASICFDRGVYFFSDCSTGGTYFINRKHLIQHDTVPLEDGDELRIGEYDLRVEIIPEPQAAPVFEDAAFIPPAQPEAPDFGAPPWEPRAQSSSLPDARLNAFGFLEKQEAAPFQQCFISPRVESPPVPPPSSPGAMPEHFDFAQLLGDFSPASAPSSQAVSGFPDELFLHLAQAEASQPQAAPVTETPAAEAPPRPPFHPGPAASAADRLRLFEMLLEGAGVTGVEVAEETLPERMHAAGVLLRDMVEGMMTVLRARAEVKSQFRVAVTMLRAVENNPLKFSVAPEDALKIMLGFQRAGFMQPEAAVREGVRDIMNHQLAFTAGIQASLTDLLRQFDPDRFEKQFDEGLVFQKKAKCWDAYRKAHPQIAREATENFFGDVFAEAYERQMRALRPGGG